MTESIYDYSTMIVGTIFCRSVRRIRRIRDVNSPMRMLREYPLNRIRLFSTRLLVLLLLVVHIQPSESLIPVLVQRRLIRLILSLSINKSAKDRHHRRDRNTETSVFVSQAMSNNDNIDGNANWIQQGGSYVYGGRNNEDEGINSSPPLHSNYIPRRSRLADRIRQLDLETQQPQPQESDMMDSLTTATNSVDSDENDDEYYFQAKHGIIQIKSKEQHA
jgi:hypothetical protein